MLTNLIDNGAKIEAVKRKPRNDWKRW